MNAISKRVMIFLWTILCASVVLHSSSTAQTSRGADIAVVVNADTPVSTDANNNANQQVISGKDLDALPDDPDELAAAWREFLSKHHEELARTHERAQDLVSRGDQVGIAAMARTHAGIKARNRARKTER